jgi:DNA-binding NarL/FixJ family response regulator
MKAEPFSVPAGDVAPQIPVCLINDMPLVRAGLRLLLEYSGMAVVAECGSRRETLAAAAINPRHVYVVDLDLTDENGLDLLRELVATYDARVIALTASTNFELHQLAVQHGARGIVLKQEVPDVLIKAIRQVDSGELWLRRALLTSLLTKQLSRAVDRKKRVDSEGQKISTLTPRERDIVRLVADGLNTKAIAEKLGVSEFTVRNHLTSILDKLNLSNKFELAVYAFRNSLASAVAAGPVSSSAQF